MNYEVTDSPRRVAEWECEQEAQAQAELAMYDDFLAACKKGDMSALCDWAPRRVVYEAVSAKYVPGPYKPLEDVIAGALDYGNGPSHAELYELLCSVAYGSDTVNAPARARELIERMASKFADMNAEAGE